MTTPKIEDDVARPANRRGPKGHGIKSHIETLEPGQSFAIPDSWRLGTVRTVAYSIPGKSFTVGKDEGGAYRVWRNS
ncbi:MAG TPA: hypothetical protein VJP88_08775 [Caulobacteraceae bacterium]|nr:hypothetical protein [Caulobacteraceae bacterium]